MKKSTQAIKAVRTLKVRNQCGLHARPAVQFVTTARAFKSEIHILRNGQRFSAISIMEVLIANLDCGAEFEVEAIGPDADAAVEKLDQLIQSIPADE